MYGLFRLIGYRSIQSPYLTDGIGHLHAVHCLSSPHLIRGKSDTLLFFPARGPVIPRSTFGQRSRLPVQAGVPRHSHDIAHAMRFAPPQHPPSSAKATVAAQHELHLRPAPLAAPSPAMTASPRQDAPRRFSSGASHSLAGAGRRLPGFSKYGGCSPALSGRT